MLGFKGELTMSDSMEALMNGLFNDEVPDGWEKRSWPSTRPLSSWLTNLTDRIAQLDDWSGNPMELLKVTWLSGFVNPQAFLTAILQVPPISIGLPYRSSHTHYWAGDRTEESVGAG